MKTLWNYEHLLGEKFISIFTCSKTIHFSTQQDDQKGRNCLSHAKITKTTKTAGNIRVFFVNLSVPTDIRPAASQHLIWQISGE